MCSPDQCTQCPCLITDRSHDSVREQDKVSIRGVVCSNCPWGRNWVSALSGLVSATICILFTRRAQCNAKTVYCTFLQSLSQWLRTYSYQHDKSMMWQWARHTGMCVCKRGQYKSFWIRMQENQMLFWRKDSIVGVDGKRWDLKL